MTSAAEVNRRTMPPTSVIVVIAFGIAVLSSPSEASFQFWGDRGAWRAAVGAPTTYRSASGSLQLGQVVPPELWADVGVHLICPGTLTAVDSNPYGLLIQSPIHSTFDIIFDSPINSLYIFAQPATGALTCWNGATYVGGFTAGDPIGVISTLSFNRIRISNGEYYGLLWNMEWGNTVPGPGGFVAFALGACFTARRRREA